jgi:FkbM family methyltransferase
VKANLKAAAPFLYPEKKDDYYPKFDSPLSVLTSKSEINYMYNKSFTFLDKNFDLEKLSCVYDLLNDQYSKDYFIRVILYSLFDVVKIRFPYYYSRQFDNLDFYNKLKVKDELSPINCSGVFLNCFDLKSIGWDIRLWSNVFGIIINFVNQQYKYKNIVKVNAGDYVIDGGACFGDTSLGFAFLAGPTGRVFPFEFMDENLSVYFKNMALNPSLSGNVELIQKPLFSVSGAPLQPIFSGAGSYVEFAKDAGAPKDEGGSWLRSISIDDFMRDNNLKKLDFIKLDIEGSELEALKGAKETIQKYKPKLAICLYHDIPHLWQIPLYIKEIAPDYKLYLDHHTIMTYETVLFAIHDA